MHQKRLPACNVSWAQQSSKTRIDFSAYLDRGNTILSRYTLLQSEVLGSRYCILDGCLLDTFGSAQPHSGCGEFCTEHPQNLSWTAAVSQLVRCNFEQWTVSCHTTQHISCCF